MIVYIYDHVQIEQAQNVFIHVHGEVNMAARNESSLKRKVEVIKCANKNPSQSSHKIAEVFNCWHKQIQDIIKKKAILSEYEASTSKSVIVELSLVTSMKLCTDGTA